MLLGFVSELVNKHGYIIITIIITISVHQVNGNEEIRQWHSLNVVNCDHAAQQRIVAVCSGIYVAPLGGLSIAVWV